MLDPATLNVNLEDRYGKCHAFQDLSTATESRVVNLRFRNRNRREFFFLATKPKGIRLTSERTGVMIQNVKAGVPRLYNGTDTLDLVLI